MREIKRDKERLTHILEAISVIENGLAAYSKDELLNNPLFYYGLVKQLEIIGEAANLLTQDIPSLKVHIDKYYSEYVD